jgi:hypothetical protein
MSLQHLFGFIFLIHSLFTKIGVSRGRSPLKPSPNFEPKETKKLDRFYNKNIRTFYPNPGQVTKLDLSYKFYESSLLNIVGLT